MVKLSVNLNKIALLRNSRRTDIPDLAHFARLVHSAGAQGITIHPRPDERHIRNSDVPLLMDVMAPWRPQFELNMEGRPAEKFLQLVAMARPEQCTLVPDVDAALTSDKGYELNAMTIAQLHPVIEQLHAYGSRVILFVDPERRVVEAVPRTGADGVEFYTGGYSMAHKHGDAARHLSALADAALAAHECDLTANAGHDLNLQNIPDLIAACPHLVELSIGHELTADALEMGFITAIRAYMAAMK